jgi:MFS family permease
LNSKNLLSQKKETLQVQGKGKGYLTLLSTSHGMNHVYQLLPPLILPKVTADYGLSNTSAGLLLACFVFSYALLQALSGYMSHIFGRRQILTIGFAISAFSFLALGFVQNLTVFAILLFVAGFGGSMYHPNGVPFLADAYEENRGQALGLHQTGGTIGSIIGPIVTGILVQSFGWRPALMVLAIPGFVLTAVLWFSISSVQSSTEDAVLQSNGSKAIDKGIYAPVLMFILAGFIYVLGQRGTDAFANQYFILGRGIASFLEASLLVASLEIAGLFSAPLCGRLSDIFDRKRILIILVVAESFSLYAITATPTIFLVIPCIAFGFAANGMLAVGDAILSDITPKNQRNKLFGINYTVSFTSSIILAPALGLIADHYNFNLGFILLSVLMPLSIPLILKTKIASKRQKECPPPISRT